MIIVGAVHECLNAKLDSLAAIIEKFCEPQGGNCFPDDYRKKAIVLTRPPVHSTPVIRGLFTIYKPLKEPHSAPGILVEALKRRRERGLTPFYRALLRQYSDNGHVVKNAVLGMAEKRSPELAGWIKEHVSFPGNHGRPHCSGCNRRITGGNQPASGVNDPCAISCEPFIQWVVEDNFVAGRPAWEVAGVQMVNDVLPWEEMKLRMLNGSHSFLAYLGYLSGFAHISDCMQDRAFRHAARTLMLDEQAPTLQIKDVDLTQYADKLIARFANPALKHKTWQIAMDGSQKLPQRMLAGIRIHQGRETDWSLLALGVAGWMRYVSGVDDAGNAIDVSRSA
ncbi:oxidoreductase yeiQ [Escherichia coli]|uniref:Oxidoreductase yeiQ n=1 Tax=Escherichia coli TaxID=562 RepID=A0A377CCC6_ECOLX|nr:oxidoreductase yeiQ [Escherichia coli]